jgi:hypothetical protein
MLNEQILLFEIRFRAEKKTMLPPKPEIIVSHATRLMFKKNENTFEIEIW